MNGQDELRELWSATPVPPVKSTEVLAMVEKRMKRFDRMVFMRNLRECAASLVVSGVFLAMALKSHEPWQRAGEWIIVISGLVTAFTLVRYGRSGKPLDAGRSLTEYVGELMKRYDQQIWLLRNVKYWYLLPMYVGLLMLTGGMLLQQSRAGAMKWPTLAMPVVYTAVFGWIWWLNEVSAAGKLRNCKEKLLRMMDEEGTDEGKP